MRFALEIGPCRMGRLLRKVAPWIILVMLIVVLTTGLPILASILPSIALWILGGFFPKKARLHCFKCDREHYFEPPSSYDGHGSAIAE